MTRFWVSLDAVAQNTSSPLIFLFREKKRVKNENCGVASFHTNATPFPSLKDKCVCMCIPHPYEHMYNHTARDVRARARAVEIQAGKAEVGSPLAGSQVRAHRYTRTRLASTGVPGGARRQPRTDVDTKPRPELLRTTVQRACVPRPDHGGPSEPADRAKIDSVDRSSATFAALRHSASGKRRTSTTAEKIVIDKFIRESSCLTDVRDWFWDLCRLTRAVSSSSSSWHLEAVK